jgi:hypothetical protein
MGYHVNVKKSIRMLDIGVRVHTHHVGVRNLIGMLDRGVRFTLTS